MERLGKKVALLLWIELQGLGRGVVLMGFISGRGEKRMHCMENESKLSDLLSNGVEPNRVSAHIVMVTAANATNRNEFLLLVTSRRTRFYPCLLGPLVQTKAKKIKCLLTNENIVVGGTSNCIVL